MRCGNNRRAASASWDRAAAAAAAAAATDGAPPLSTVDGDDRLFSPCLCSGSIKYVHESCLRRWRASGSRSARVRCPQCKFQYKTRRMRTKKRVIAFRLVRWVLAVFLAVATNALFAALLPYAARCVVGEDDGIGVDGTGSIDGNDVGDFDFDYDGEEEEEQRRWRQWRRRQRWRQAEEEAGGFFLHFHWSPEVYDFLLPRRLLERIQYLDYEWRTVTSSGSQYSERFT